MNTENTLSPSQDVENVTAAIMESENLPRAAAIAGAQRYAIDEARDLDERATLAYANHRFNEGNQLAYLAREYRRAAMKL